VEDQLAILMGGRVAEEVTQDDITTGAGNDIERATDMARRMVCEWGMSELGPLAYGNKEEPVFLGREFAQRADHSGDTAVRIDKEIERIVSQGYDRATQILTQYRTVLNRVAEELLEHETLDGREVYRMIEELTGIQREPKHVPLPIHAPEGGREEDGGGDARPVTAAKEDGARSPVEAVEEEPVAAVKRSSHEPEPLPSPEESG
jgi:cell division protease FtsH